MNRYLGEEEDSESSGESRARVLLAKLQEQAKAREQQSILNIADKYDDHQANIKKKKRKPEQQETEGIQQKSKKRGKQAKKTDFADGVILTKKHKRLSLSDESAKTGKTFILLCVEIKMHVFCDFVGAKQFCQFRGTTWCPILSTAHASHFLFFPPNIIICSTL